MSAVKRLTNSLPIVLKPKNTIDARLRAVIECESALDALMLEVVDQARAEGMSWQAIGDILGTSRQAAQQRFGRYRDEDGDDGVPAPV